jgi:hypothetical protein
LSISIFSSAAAKKPANNLHSLYLPEIPFFRIFLHTSPGKIASGKMEDWKFPVISDAGVVFRRNLAE